MFCITHTIEVKVQCILHEGSSRILAYSAGPVCLQVLKYAMLQGAHMLFGLSCKCLLGECALLFCLLVRFALNLFFHLKEKRGSCGLLYACFAFSVAPYLLHLFQFSVHAFTLHMLYIRIHILVQLRALYHGTCCWQNSLLP